MSTLGAPWRVVRVSGLLVPGFTKRFDAGATRGTTYWCGVRIGAFDVVRTRGACELRYRAWPVVDVLLGAPQAPTTRIESAGYLHLGGGRRLRFCRFRLERP
ncbi:MAG: hypothetical protein JWM98_643 [Thermoleophilia bacterium]|nr:hypothetical protein [Thermoleophilia bacterium]